MRLLIILLLIAQSCFSSARAQMSYADSLLQLELIIYQSNGLQVDQNKLNKVDFMIASDSIGGTIMNELSRINYKNLTDSIEIRALWNATLLSYMNENPELALVYWNRYEALTKDTTIECTLLGFLCSETRDKQLNDELFASLIRRDASFVELSPLHAPVKESKGTLIKKIGAFVLPGSGLIINGNVGKGILSLGLNTGTVFLVRYLIINNAYANAFLWGTNLISKFYLGGVRLTSIEIEKKNKKKKRMRAQQRTRTLENSLKEYPLNLRLVN